MELDSKWESSLDPHPEPWTDKLDFSSISFGGFTQALIIKSKVPTKDIEIKR